MSLGKDWQGALAVFIAWLQTPFSASIENGLREQTSGESKWVKETDKKWKLPLQFETISDSHPSKMLAVQSFLEIGRNKNQNTDFKNLINKQAASQELQKHTTFLFWLESISIYDLLTCNIEAYKVYEGELCFMYSHIL